MIIAVEDILKNNFISSINIEETKNEIQLYGKFIKTKRQEDNIIEFRSRWIYTLNIRSNSTDIIFSLHQQSKNLGKISNYLYTGILILKTAFPLLTFIDYLEIHDERQKYLKTKLDKGVYVIIPICSGYYSDSFISNENLKDISLDLINHSILEEKHVKSTDKTKKDFSIISKNIIEHIFENFNTNRSYYLSWIEVKIFYNFIFQSNKSTENDILLELKPFLNENSTMSFKQMKNYLFHLYNSKGESLVKEIFKLFGFSHIFNNDCRHFYIGVFSDIEVEITFAEGLNSKFNNYAICLLIKQLGNVLCETKEDVKLLSYRTEDESIIYYMIENMSNKDKMMKLEIKTNNYISLNSKKYEGIVRTQESNFIFTIALDKNNILVDDEEIEYSLSHNNL